jgi:hypothetical protein
MKRLFRRILAGWILAFALTGGYWGMMLSPGDRWDLYFTRFDLWAFLAATLAGGGLLGLGAFALERFLPRTKPLLVASFWWWLALYLANSHPEVHQKIAGLMHWGWLDGLVWRMVVWGVGALGMACALFLPSWRRGAARGWRILLLFWPILFLIPAYAWFLPPHDAAYGKGLDFSRVPGNGKPPVVVLMFDMLGYEMVFDEAGQVRPGFPNFEAFCSRADVWHAADSAGHGTYDSIPGFIVRERLGTDTRIIRQSFDSWSYSDGTHSVSPREFAEQSLPVLVRGNGGRAQAIGLDIPWDELLPGVWDATESMSSYTGNHGTHEFGVPPTLAGCAAEHLAWYLLWVSKSPLGAAWKLAGFDYRTEARIHDANTSLVERSGRFLREGLSPGDFFFVHVDLPHFPYVLGAGGGRLPAAQYYDHKNGLRGQLEGADWVLGRWMEALAASPAGRDAWVVVTSDHSMHRLGDRNWKGSRTHVPFLVHRPGQTERRDIAEPADLADVLKVLPELPGFGGE